MPQLICGEIENTYSDARQTAFLRWMKAIPELQGLVKDRAISAASGATDAQLSWQDFTDVLPPRSDKPIIASSMFWCGVGDVPKNIKPKNNYSNSNTACYEIVLRLVVSASDVRVASDHILRIVDILRRYEGRKITIEPMYGSDLAKEQYQIVAASQKWALKTEHHPNKADEKAKYCGKVSAVNTINLVGPMSC